MKHHRGFTFIEMIIAIVISTIAMMALAAPFMAERRFWLSGTAQSESQRDAQVVLRAIARKVRESTSYNVGTNTFNVPCGTCQFRLAGASNNQLQMVDNCTWPITTTTWIDGNRSQVTNFTITPVNSRLVQVQLSVTYNNRESESLTTEMYLRNAT